MPSYDFKCNKCQTTFSLIYKSFGAYAQAEQHLCTACSSSDTVRKIGRIALAKGDKSRLDALSDPTALAQIDENDPKAVGKFMKQLGQGLESDLGDQVDTTIDKMQK